MSPRAALVLVRSAPLRVPAVRLPSIRRPSARALAYSGAVLAGCALVYVGARESSLFAVRSLDVQGPASIEDDVRAALRPFEGASLVALDTASVEARLAALPTVRSASVDRAFPHGLTVRVVPERPLAVYRDGARAWIVSASGRVIAEIEPTARPRVPRIRVELPRRANPGQRLATSEVRTALAVLAAVPRRFPARVVYARVERAEVSLVVHGGIEIRLADATNVQAKLAAAAGVLRSLPAEERVGLAYLDVSVPERVVGGANSQP